MNSLKLSQTNAIANGVNHNDVFFYHFQRSGSDLMNVNGLTPVTFTLPLPANSNFLINSLSFVIGAEENIDINKFGNVATLANGIAYSINGNQAGTIKNNGDVLLVSSFTSIGAVRIGANTQGVIVGRWDFSDTFSGNCPRVFNNQLTITIRDNLSALPYFRMGCHGVFFE
jgi:hypothetical protein